MKLFKTSAINFVLIVMAWVFLFVFMEPQEACANTYDAYVVKIVDGDTVEVIMEGRKKIIRLWGIDSPEWDQPHANDAKVFLRRKIKNKKVEIWSQYYDDYGRVVAQIFLNKENVNEILVAEGLAWVHVYYCNTDICRSWDGLQDAAMLQSKGLWKDKNPVPPWRWKRLKRRNRYNR